MVGVSLGYGYTETIGGGAILGVGGTINSYYNTIAYNTASSINDTQVLGGGVYVYYGELNVYYTSIFSNKVNGITGDGGGIGIVSTRTRVEYSEFVANEAQNLGFAVYANPKPASGEIYSVSINNSCITSNKDFGETIEGPQFSIANPGESGLYIIDTAYNWWGDANGPGSEMTQNTNNLPFRINAITNCVPPRLVDSAQRNVVNEATKLHSLARVLGLPMPFERLPYDVEGGEVVTAGDIQGYGPTTFAVMSGSYPGTHDLHSGIDYFGSVDSKLYDPEAPSDIYDIPVTAICDGILIESRNKEKGGTTGDNNQGEGVSLRCFADDPEDTDSDGYRNLSNIVVVYNHLYELNKQYTAGQNPPIVKAGDFLGYSYDYDGEFGVRSHIHLEIYFATGYLHGANPIEINPLFMYQSDIAQCHYDNSDSCRVTFYSYFPIQGQSYIPNDNRGIDDGDLTHWSLGAMTGDNDVNTNGFWGIQKPDIPGTEWTHPNKQYAMIPHLNDNLEIIGNLEPFFLQYIANRGRALSNPDHISDYYLYIGPNCINVIIGQPYPDSCQLEYDTDLYELKIDPLIER